MNTASTPITAQEFFKHWVDVCKQRNQVLTQDFTKPPAMTAHVLTEDNSIIKTIADRMRLTPFSEYLGIDAILFNEPQDRVPDAPAGTTWIRRIRVAFEHENYFNSGLFKEVSRLLITDCDLRVVVSYPDSEDELLPQLDYLYKVIQGSDRSHQIAEDLSLLFIVEMGTMTCLDWWGYIYKDDGWQRLAL